MIVVQLNGNSDIIYPIFNSYQNNFTANGTYSFLNSYRVTININLFEKSGFLVSPQSFRIVNIGNSGIYVYYTGHRYSILANTELNVTIHGATNLVMEGIDGGSFTYEINADINFGNLYKR